MQNHTKPSSKKETTKTGNMLGNRNHTKIFEPILHVRKENLFVNVFKTVNCGNLEHAKEAKFLCIAKTVLIRYPKADLNYAFEPWIRRKPS